VSNGIAEVGHSPPHNKAAQGCCCQGDTDTGQRSPYQKVVSESRDHANENARVDTRQVLLEYQYQTGRGTPER